MKEWILKLDGGRKSIIRHILLWVVFYVGFTLIMSIYDELNRLFLLNLLTTLLFAIAYYLLRHWQIPYLYKKGRILLFIFSLIGSTLLCYSLYWGFRIAVVENIIYLNPQQPFEYLGEYLIRNLRFYSPAFLLLVWEFQHNRKKDQLRIRKIEKEKIATELKFLKAQINPHFLFNTLNNLYSFVLTESPKASDMLNRLTGIFEYAFEKSQLSEVPLKLEIDTISDYLALEKIRYGDRLHVAYKAEGDLNIPVSPLILLSIIENAFKHGASGDIDSPKIDIDIHTIDQSIHCKVWNTKSNYKGEINDEYKSGIGLSNIKRQLDLIYPANHLLKIDDHTDTFTLTLSINTAA